MSQLLFFEKYNNHNNYQKILSKKTVVVRIDNCCNLIICFSCVLYFNVFKNQLIKSLFQKFSQRFKQKIIYFKMFCCLLYLSFEKELRACVGMTEEHKLLKCPLENSTYFDISQINGEVEKGYDSVSIYALCNLSNSRKYFFISSKNLENLKNIEIAAGQEKAFVGFDLIENISVTLVNVKLTNIIAKFTSKFVFKTLTLENCVTQGSLLFAHVMDVDTLTIVDTSLIINNAHSTRFSLARGITANINWVIMVSNLYVEDIDKDYIVVYMGTSIIFKDPVTKYSLSIQRESSKEMNIFIRNFFMDNLMLSFADLFISRLFSDVRTYVEVIRPLNVVFLPSSWERTLLSPITFEQYSNCSVTIQCSYVPASFVCHDGSETFFDVSTSNAAIEEILCNNSFVTVNATKWSSCQLDIKNINFSMYSSLAINTERINASISSITFNKDNKKSFIYGRISMNSLSLYYGMAVIQSVNLSSPCSIYVYNASAYLNFINFFAKSFINHITFDCCNDVSCIFQKKDIIIEFNYIDFYDNFLINFPTRSCTLGNDTYIICNNIYFDHFSHYCSILLHAVLSANVPFGAHSFCLIEHDDYEDYCKEGEIIIDSNRNKLDLTMVSENADINIRVVGNFPTPCCGLCGINQKIKITGVIPGNSSIILYDHGDYNFLSLTNITVFYYPPAKKMMHISKLEMINSDIKTNATFEVSRLDSDPDKLPAAVSSYNINSIYLYFDSKNVTVNAHDDYCQYNNYTLNTKARVYLSTLDDSDVYLFIYGYFISKVFFTNNATIHAYFYNDNCLLNTNETTTCYFYTKIIPKYFILPDNVYFKGNISVIKGQFIRVNRKVQIFSDVKMHLIVDALIFNGDEPFINSSDVTVHSNSVKFVKCSIHSQLNIKDVMGISIDPWSIVCINLPNSSSLSVKIMFYMVSVPDLFVVADIPNINLNLTNVGANTQLMSDDLWGDVNVTAFRIYSDVFESYNINYNSNSWAFNGTTRKFDLSYVDINPLRLFSITKREEETNPTKQTKEKMFSKKVIIGLAACVVALIIVVLASFLVLKKVRANKIKNYMSSTAEERVMELV